MLTDATKEWQWRQASGTLATDCLHILRPVGDFELIHSEPVSASTVRNIPAQKPLFEPTLGLTWSCGSLVKVYNQIVKIFKSNNSPTGIGCLRKLRAALTKPKIPLLPWLKVLTYKTPPKTWRKFACPINFKVQYMSFVWPEQCLSTDFKLKHLPCWNSFFQISKTSPQKRPPPSTCVFHENWHSLKFIS